MKIKEMALICQNRYARHVLVWKDKDGVSRCRRCHAPWTPEVKPPTKHTQRESRELRHQRSAAHVLPELPARTHNPDCKHPPPFKDPMEAHRFAQEAMVTGVEQRKCSVCGEWVWSNLYKVNAEA